MVNCPIFDMKRVVNVRCEVLGCIRDVSVWCK